MIWAIVVSVATGLLANELGDVSPWLARKLVVHAARLWTRDVGMREVYAEEWRAVIDERPGKLLKLFTSFGFLASGVTIRLNEVAASRGRGRERPGPRHAWPQPLYARALRLRHLEPNATLCLIFLFGSTALGLVLALAELTAWWGVFVLPAAVAVMVKINDLVAGAATRAAGRERVRLSTSRTPPGSRSRAIG